MNGLWVAFNRCFTGTVKVTETSPGLFEYDYGESVGLDVPEKELVFKILLSAYRSKNQDVFIRDILHTHRRKKEITADRLKDVFKNIHEYELLEGSSWEVVEYESRGEKHLKISKHRT